MYTPLVWSWFTGMLSIPDQPAMTRVLEQCGSNHLWCVSNFLFMFTCSSLNILSGSLDQLLLIWSRAPWLIFLWIFFFLQVLCLSYSVRLQSMWILILVSQFCQGLRAVFWNADLWRCHHSSMSWVSALPPSLALPFTQPWWHALFLTDSSGQPQSFGNFFSKRWSC